MAFAGGIDLGGTKIEATLFDAGWQPLESKRIATPRESYPALLAALVDQTNWILGHDGCGGLPIGIGVPGRSDPVTGLSFTSNLPASGQPLRSDLKKAVGRDIHFGNDCDLFALSEAVLGAGAGHDTVFGLIIGTGIGGGICHQKQLYQTNNGSAGEVGHLPVSAALVKEFDLPLLTCGCGHPGCYETLGAGPGLAILAKQFMNAVLTPREIARRSAAGEAGAAFVMQIWLRLIAELIGSLQRTVDPDCVVLGGGVSNIPGIAVLIADILPPALLSGTTPPIITVAKYGDSSGTRGAALAAVQELDAG